MLKLLSKSVLLATCLLVGIFIGSAVMIKYEMSVFKAYSWGSDPIIANCYGGDFNELYLIQSVKYWEYYGHDVAFIEQDPPDVVCQADSIDGFIIIKKKRQDGMTLAYTRRKVVLGEIRAATIYFNPGAYRLENVIEHELGHAFGYKHLEIEGHVMHPDHESMGTAFWIP